MPTPTDPRREHPSTYVVQDRSSEEELARLVIQDHLMTTSMGGVLSEQPDPTVFHRVLDVGCGTGGWLIETAKSYPAMTLLAGVDVSSRMIEYARTQAQAQQVAGRVQFITGDALRILEFPNSSFDLVNQRFGVSWVRTWDWPKLLQEFQRVCRPGGTVRLTEGDQGKTNSPALTRLLALLLEAFHHAGHYFTLERNGITSHLEHLLQQYGLQDVQTRTYTLDYRAGTAQGERFIEDTRYGFRTVLPFLRKWTQVPDDYEAIYQQALSEMQQPDFVLTSNLLTAWGTSLD